MTGTADIVASIDGVPVAITHGYDVGTRPDGSVEFEYNFFDYVFGTGEQTIFARSYFGEREVDIRSHARDLDTWPLALRALIYLQLRYHQIKVMMPGGYEALPKTLARRVAEGVRQYLDASALSYGGKPS